MIFWLLLGLMGASYYLVPEETESELYSTPLAVVQLAVMLVAGLGTLFSFWFLRLSMGKPFTESPMPWPYLIALGVVLFLVNIGITIFRSRRWTAVSVILFGGMTGMALLYLINVVQTYLYRMLGMDFMIVRTEYVSFWLFMVWLFGLVLFLPGVILYVWDFFTLGARAMPEPAEPALA